MSSQAGVGFSENVDSHKAGEEAARGAMKQLGREDIDLAILFSTARHDPYKLREGIHSVIGSKARLFGGYGFGVIDSNNLGYDGYQVGIALISSDTMKVDMFIEDEITNNEFNVGVALGKQIKNKTYTGSPSMLFIYDAVKGKRSDNLVVDLNLATPLVRGMDQSIEDWPTSAGIGLIGDWAGSPTYQWFDEQIETQSASALVISGGIQMDAIIMHGCKPAGRYHTITRAEHNVVLEIDGKRAIDAAAELLGQDAYDSWKTYPFFLTLGVNKGDKFDDFIPENYANRLVMGIDEKRGGLIMFEPDLETGQEIQIMQRSIDFDYVEQRSIELLNRVGNRRPFLGLYIDCAARCAAVAGTEGEEAAPVQEVIGSKMPLLGMYSGVEVAKVGNDMQALDWTGILCVFSE